MKNSAIVGSKPPEVFTVEEVANIVEKILAKKLKDSLQVAMAEEGL